MPKRSDYVGRWMTMVIEPIRFTVATQLPCSLTFWETDANRGDPTRIVEVCRQTHPYLSKKDLVNGY